MELRLERRWFKPDYTVGKLYINDEYFCDTLEDRVVDINKNGVFDGKEMKVYGQSAIPYGTYQVVYNYSPRFKRKLPRLMNVPHFEGILIHPGNTPADTSGCILVGRNTSVGRLSESRLASEQLNKIIENAQNQGDNIKIKIV